MTKFTDGPAAHVLLELSRSPLFLRVVKDTTYATAVCKKDRREWDALDQLEDSTRPWGLRPGEQRRHGPRGRPRREDGQAVRQVALDGDVPAL